MKKIIFTFALFCLGFTSLIAQDFAGKRIVSGNLSMNLTGGSSSPLYSSSNLILNASLLTGKIRANNTYTAYGFRFGVNSQTTPQSSGGVIKDYTNSNFTLGPTIQFGKFVKVFDQFYFAPNTSLSVSATFGSNNNPSSTSNVGGFGIGLNVSPLNFVYQVKDNFLLSMNLGGFGANYNRVGTTTNNVDSSVYSLNIYGNISNNSGIGAYYLF
jgi:hypothetical protein